MSAARGLRLLIFGAPGSGKGTIAGWIQRDYGVPQVSSGDLLRRHISDGTEIGKQAKDIVSQGGTCSLPFYSILNVLYIYFYCICELSAFTVAFLFRVN